MRKSPFPGLDPYLEQHWGDVHTTLMVYARNQLNAQLPEDLQARVQESLAVETDFERQRIVYPDVRIVDDAKFNTGPFLSSDTATEAVAVAEPCVLVIADEPRTQRHLEIVDSSGRVITAIEVLSPGNKIGVADRAAYKKKQREFLDGGVNLVEIDLIRSGRFVLAVPEEQIPAAFRTPCLICIRRAIQPQHIELYRVPLRERLPNIPIPLRPTDRDVVLQLQPLLDDCYRDGRYSRLDYRADLEPALDEDDDRWAQQLLREHGLR